MGLYSIEVIMKIHIVTIGEGEYEDYFETHHCAYFDEKKAKRCVSRLNKAFSKLKNYNCQEAKYETIMIKDANVMLKRLSGLVQGPKE